MECLGNKMVLLPMIVLPLILCAAMPAAVIVLGLGSGVFEMSGAEQIERILPLYDIPAGFTGTAERVFYVFLNYILMPIFLIIPLMVSVIIAAHSVAGEKEKQSLETLLYTPISNREFVLGKVLSAFLPAVAVSLGSFALYFLTANSLFFALRGRFVVSSPAWIPTLLVVFPAASLLGLGAAFLASLKSKTFMEAQQVGALVVLPCVLLVGGQLGGIVVISPAALWLSGLALLAADYLLLAKIGPKFDREKVIACL
jgi:ABC-type Na+ efflux pump permease subunit